MDDLKEIKENFIKTHKYYSKYLEKTVSGDCMFCQLTSVFATCSDCTMYYNSHSCTDMKTYLSTPQRRIDRKRIKKRKIFHKQMADYLKTLNPECFTIEKMIEIGKKAFEIDKQIYYEIPK